MKPKSSIRNIILAAGNRFEKPILGAITALAIVASAPVATAEPADPNLACQLGILDLTANDGKNPTTNEPWQPGDRYRLAFWTSGTMPGTKYTDINVYNTFVQNLANASTAFDIKTGLTNTLSHSTWKVIGSTWAVDARDNTATNPTVDGPGESIFLLDGTTVIAANYAELWSGTIRAMINQREDGTAGTGNFTLTGTRNDGTKRTGTTTSQSDRAPLGGRAPGQGGDIASQWIWRTNTSSTNSLPYYALSDPLFVIDRNDDVPPTLLSFENDVADGPITFGSASVKYTVTFSEAILPTTLTASVFENKQAAPIAIENVRQLSDDTAKFEVTVTPLSGGSIQLQIKAGAVITDLNGNPLDTGSPLFDETTIAVNAAAPVITARSPAHEGGRISIGTSIVATFDQALALGTGDIEIRDLDGGSTTQFISVTDDTQVTLVDNVLTVKPALRLATQTPYAVLIPDTAFRNYNDLAFAGITSDSQWTFTTWNLVGNLAGQLGILDLGANESINPATAEPWKHGDRYRLVFISSKQMNARDTHFPSPYGSWNSIDTWNAEAQDIANNAVGQDLSGTTWKVVGSTTSVNARDNTRTNPDPAADGNGHPIMLIDGKTIVAGDFNELWGPTGVGHAIRNVIRFTENVVGGANQHINDVPPSWFPITGTNASGVSLGSSNSLRNIQAGGSIRQGQGGHTQGWIDRANIPGQPSAASSESQPIYVMSDPLFVIDLDDDAPPTLVSFANNVDDGPLPFPDPGSVVYTVTFSEAMLPSTVTAADFGNEGSSGITIDSVVQQEDAAVFLVTVTPTSAGTLQLRINPNAELTDLNGNPLNTGTALVDGVTIDVGSGSAYDTWSGGAPFDGDSNGDGVPDGLAFLLGADAIGDNALGLLPTAEEATGALVLTFDALPGDDRGTAQLMLEYSTSLATGAWTTVNVPGTAGVTTDGDVTFTITETDNDLLKVSAAISDDAAAGGKLFARLKGENPQD